MRRLLITLLLLVAAAPALADHRPCTQTLVDQGVCDRRTDVLVYWSVPEPRHEDLVAALAVSLGYQEVVACQQKRLVDDHGVLQAAGPGDGACTPELAGQEVPNPQSDTEAAHAYLGAQLARKAREHRIAERVEAARRTAEAEVPAVGP